MSKSILEKMIKNKDLSDKIYNPELEVERYLSTGVITLNLLHKGRVDKGIKYGCIEQISAHSSYGKTFIGLSILKNAQRAGMETIVIDTERSFDVTWAENVGIRTDDEHLIIFQSSNITKIKQFIALCLEGKTKKERMETFFLFDSWGNLVDDVTMTKAADGNSAMNMRLTQEKNILANYMKEQDATFYVVNGVYQNIGGFGEQLVVAGGSRIFFNSQSIVLAKGKRKEVDSAKNVIGAIITAEAHKGRDAVEKSTKLEYRIKHNGGLDIYYGLLPDALEYGCISKPKVGWLTRTFIEGDKNWRESEIYNKDFWSSVFQHTGFKDYLESKYAYEGKPLDISENDVDDVLYEGEES